MIISYSLNKRQAIAVTGLNDISATAHIQSLLPKEAMQRVKTGCIELMGCSEDKGKPGQRSERGDHRHFKIRTCSTKGQTKIPSVHGKQIGNNMAIEQISRLKPETKEELAQIIIKRFSANHTPAVNNTDKKIEK
jgi:hypothetical protein